MNPLLKKFTALVFLFLLVTPLILFAQTPEIKLALIGFENMDEDDEHDYLTALITAVIREDLSNTEGIILLERGLMNKVLKEQQLQISGLFDDSDAVEAGKLLGSDYLAGGGYIVMDTEVLVDVTLISVETGEVVSFSSRGNSEDIIHMSAEKLARNLTGRRHMYRTEDSDRPIIKETLMPPGKLKLFSPLIDARIYLDDEFYGYTVGDNRVPIEIELQPGMHTVETDLGSNFGVIIEPEILFEKWKKEFRIVSGKTVVLEDPTRHFNEGLYRLHNIVYESETFYTSEIAPYNTQHDFSFTDRNGVPIEGSLTIYFEPTEDNSLSAQVQFFYDYQREVYTIECEPGNSLEFEKTLGFTDLEIELNCRYSNRMSASWSLSRNDVYQGMHREQPDY
ncbi:MAG: hypothetical protein PQJ61_12390 [Spirochaetales bacterium]|uniref:PEGA domain-containing protein n=1 Tax=Candidatus Thalassospirochaeta sargassi TaxID=3119039 RepID=A0AAJ1MNB7_9SPIO|nr:hypothetical protein [Spirochaetales bacterium]